MKRNNYLKLISIFLLGIVILVLVIVYTNLKTVQNATPNTSQSSQAKKASPTIANPLIFIPSKAVSEFFQTHPSSSTLTNYKAQIAKLPPPAGPITIQNCSVNPAIAVVPKGTVLTIKNSDPTTHTIKYQNQNITVAASGSATLTNTLAKGDLSTYDCDTSQYVGVIYSK
jgi:hypothetical protein